MSGWTYKVRLYLLGATAAAINASVSTVTLVVVDPEKFNPFAGAGWHKLAAAVIVAAIAGFFLYMRDHPLPDPSKDTDAYSAARRKIGAINDKLEEVH